MSKEVEEKVETYKVSLRCDCGGQMLPTGICLNSCPALYPHKCNKCNNMENLSESYPIIRQKVIK